MKPFKLLAALTSAAAMVSQVVADVSTVIVASPITTRTHTNIVYVTATAGSAANTCSIAVCESENANATSLSTIRMTSYTTSTTTQIVTPPDVTTTVTSASVANVSTSCAMRPASTITVTVTETSPFAAGFSGPPTKNVQGSTNTAHVPTESVAPAETPLPVITRSVYPIPATSVIIKTSTETQSHASRNGSTTIVSSTIVPPAPYMNTSIIYTKTYTSIFTMVSVIDQTTAHLSIASAIRGIPEVPVHLTAAEGFSGSMHNDSATTTGWYLESSAGSVRPPRLFSLLARCLSAIGLVNTQPTVAFVSDGNEPEALSDICQLEDCVPKCCPDMSIISEGVEPRFEMHPKPFISGPLSIATKEVRDVLENYTSNTSVIPGTLMLTSTVVRTITQITSTISSSATSAVVAVSDSALPAVSSTLVVSPVDASATDTSLSDVSTTITTNALSTTMTLTLLPANTTENYDVNNATVSITVTLPPSTAIVSNTLTFSSHTVVTDHVYTTSTFVKTVSQTYATFTGGAAPTANGVTAEPGVSICSIMLAMCLALVTAI